MNLLDRMAEALRRVVDTDEAAIAELKRNGFEYEDHAGLNLLNGNKALLAEYERVKARTVMLTFEKADHELSVGGFDYIVMDKTYGKPCMVVSVKPSEDYAYAVLPQLPGPDVFQ